MASFQHRVRYSECDGQGVVFNANYLAYCDDAFDVVLRDVVGDFREHGWEFVAVRAAIEWSASARPHDTIVMDVTVTRLGTTSFDVRFFGTCDGTALFVDTHTYVGVDPATRRPIPPPAAIRDAFDALSA